MANRVLARYTDSPGEILEDGEYHQVGMWDEVVIERSAAGAPGLVFIMSRRDGDLIHDQMVVRVKDGAAFLRPVLDWLNVEPYSVVATTGKNGPESIVGTYRGRFDAEAVAVRWNEINGQHGITYRVEKDY